MDCSLPGSSVREYHLGKNTGVDSHFLLQGFFLTQGSNPGFLRCRQIFYHLKREVAQSCPTLCNSMDCVLPGLSVRGIFQARVLESGLPFSSPGDLPDPWIKPRFPTLQADALPHHLKAGDKSWKQRGDMWTWLFICCFTVPFLIPYLCMKLWNKVRKGSDPSWAFRHILSFFLRFFLLWTIFWSLYWISCNVAVHVFWLRGLLEPSSLRREWTHTPTLEGKVNQRTTREVP